MGATVSVTLDSTQALSKLALLQRAMGESVGLDKVTRDSVVCALIRDADPEDYRRHYQRRGLGHPRQPGKRARQQADRSREERF